MQVDSQRKKKATVGPKKPVDPHTQKKDLQNGLKTLHFLYRTGLLVFSVKYLVVPFMHIYEMAVYSYVGQQVEPRIRLFDEKVLGPFMGWVLFALHFALRYLLLATYPAISVLIKFVLIPLKRGMIQGYNKIQATAAEVDPDAATKLETIAVQKTGKTVPSATVLAERAKEDVEYKETTFQFTKIAFKIFYNRLQLSFVDAQFVWGYGPRDPETDSRLALEREVLIDQREYLLALRNYDDRVEAAMKRRRMAAAAEAVASDLEDDNTVGETHPAVAQEKRKPTLENTQSKVSFDAPPSEKPSTLISGVTEVIEGLASKVKNGLGLAVAVEEENDNLARGSPIVEQIQETDELPSPPTPPQMPTSKNVVLSPTTAALDARVRKAEHLSAVAITPYAAVAVAKVQSSERQAVKKAFAKKKLQKKVAYQKTHFVDRLKSVLGFRGKIDGQLGRENEEISSTFSSSGSVHHSVATTTESPVDVTEGDTYVTKDTISEKDDKVKDSTKSDLPDKVQEEKERNSKLPDVFNKGKLSDPSLTFFDRLLGRENESKAAEEITDTLLPEIKNPLATRKSSRRVEDEDDEDAKNGQSSDDDESVKRREEEAMRKRRMEYSSRQNDQENEKENFEEADDKVQASAENTNGPHSHSAAKQPKNAMPSPLDKDVMAEYHNPFLKKKEKNSKIVDDHSMSLNEEGESSNDVTPSSSTQASSRDLKRRTADVLAKKAADPSSLEHGALTGNMEVPRTASKPALHPFFLSGATATEEAEDRKYMRMVGESNPF